MTFKFAAVIDAPAEALFAFHRSPANLSLLMSGWKPFRLLSHSGSIEVGQRVWVEENIGILPIVMCFQQTLCDPPVRFAETLVHGPFLRFDHEHRFEPSGGSTCMTDVLDVELPWWLGGGQAMRRLVAPRLRMLFQYRQETLQRLARQGRIAGHAVQADPGD